MEFVLERQHCFKECVNIFIIHILPKINATAYLHARYPTTMRDLQGIFDGIHLLVGSAGGNYGCIVVDDLQKYFTTPPQVNTQHLMT